MAARKSSKVEQVEAISSLEGHFLIAMPSMPDKRFQRAVIYVCAHSEESAMSLILNRPSDKLTFPDLLEHLELEPASDDEDLLHLAEEVVVHVGGPVDSGRGFVLHSPDYFSESGTVAVEAGVCLTTTVDILKAIACGKGPQRAILALGYAGWRGGQLESELLANGWLTCPANLDVLFDPDSDSKYERALALLGIEPGRLASAAGRA